MAKEMIAPGYSEGDKRELAWMRDALKWAEKNPDGHVVVKDREWAGEFDKRIPAKEFRSYVQERVGRAAGRRGGEHYSRGRKDTGHQRTEWERDQRAVDAFKQGTQTSQPGLHTAEYRKAHPEIAEHYRNRQQDR